MLYSYDIFDTILIRKVPKPTDVFTIMEKELGNLWNNEIYGSFSEMRRKAEFWHRRLSTKEISIDGIYRVIQKKTHLSEAAIQTIKAIELNVEKAYSLLNVGIVNEIKQKLIDMEPIVLISDMYWHEKQIREWLSEKDGIFSDLPIYISCDYGETKKSGKLYRLVKEKEKASFDAWIHTGDNTKADDSSPKKLGIKSVIVKGGRKYDFEKNLDARNESILETYGVIKESIANTNGNAFNLGASIVAPMVYQYVNWVVEEAVARKIRKLYFVLRDGYILKKVADIIIRQKEIDIKTEFIFGSRVAWRFPEITIEKLRNMSLWEKSNWIFRDPAVAYVPFERLGFSNKQVDELLGTEFGKKELHSFAEFKDLLLECLKNSLFCKQLEMNISEARQSVDLYIRQTISFSESFALVDTNSTGKTQADLNGMLSQIHQGFEGLRFFYHTYLANIEPDKEKAFVFINSKEADRRFPEAFFRAPYNQCYGYKIIAGKAIPKFHESDKCAWNYSFDYDSYLQGILEFAGKAEGINVDDYVNILLKVVNFDILSKEEVEQAAKLPFNPDINGDEILDFYPKMKFRSLLHPFTELIYYPKGSYYAAGGIWIALYKLLSFLVKMKRKDMKG